MRLNDPVGVCYPGWVAGAIGGVWRALAPHSSYVSRLEWEKRSALERGELATIGVILEEVDGAATVLTVYPRSPADKNGLVAGDRLLALNDTAVAGLDMQTLEPRLAGEERTNGPPQLPPGPGLAAHTRLVPGRGLP